MAVTVTIDYSGFKYIFSFVALYIATKAGREPQELMSCAGNKRRAECESVRGLGATTGRCQWRQGTEKRTIYESYCPLAFYTAGHEPFSIIFLFLLQGYLKHTPPVPQT